MKTQLYFSFILLLLVMVAFGIGLNKFIQGAIVYHETVTYCKDTLQGTWNHDTQTCEDAVYATH